MERLNYGEEIFEKVSVCGIECEFNDMRIEYSSISARVQPGVLVNFFGTLICDKPLPIGDGGILWLMDGDFKWL